MAEASPAPAIYVLAGTNGAGKSSIGGEMLLAKGIEYFNPDVCAKRIRTANPGMTQAEANSVAWHEGKRLLEKAIAERLDFAFESTLGGNTITALLETALAEGSEVRVWYAGLSSPELHIARVRARVGRGGHDIPESDIRKRYDAGRKNLIRLLPQLTSLRLYDNSAEGAAKPKPVLILHMDRGRIVGPPNLNETPEWAKPIVAAAMKLSLAQP